MAANHAARHHDDGDMKMVVKKKANKQRTKIPPMSEERIKELNDIMFSYNPLKNRRDPRIKGNSFPPWAYTPESIPEKNSVEYMFHPDIFKTNTCNRGTSCQMSACAFIHPNECYVPRWRATGAVFDGVFYPPLPITYEWFKFMMLSFKTTGPCTALYNHDHARCHYYHVDPKDPTVYYDRREPLDVDPVTESWKPLTKTCSATMRQFHPNTYKIEKCRRIESQQKCTKGRYCSFNHLNHEDQKIGEHLNRLMQELLRHHKAQQYKMEKEVGTPSENATPVPSVAAPSSPLNFLPQSSDGLSAAAPAPAPPASAPVNRVNPISPIMPPPISPQIANPSSGEDVEEIAQKMEKLNVLKAQLEERRRQLGSKVSADAAFGSQLNASSPVPPAMAPPGASPIPTSMDSFWGPQAMPRTHQSNDYMMGPPLTQMYAPPGHNQAAPPGIRPPSIPQYYRDMYAPRPMHHPQQIDANYAYNLSKPLEQWTKQEVFAWVNSGEPIVAEIGGQLYENDVDGSVLAQLNDMDLQELGVTSLGKRKKLLTAIALIKVNQNPAGMSPALRQDAFSLF